MAKPKNQTKPTKQMHQDQNQQPLKSEKTPSWSVLRGLLTCKDPQTQHQQQQKQQQQQQTRQQQKEHQKQQHEQAVEENGKKCKKMKCSGSLCSNTKVMHRPETGSPEVHKKRASLGSSSNASNDASSRSMKAPLHELNGVVSTASSFSASSNSSIGGSFRGMPFRRFSGCYECRMVVDPVLGFTRDPSLRSSICSCPDCGEIFMKPENLELHQAVRHAGISLFFLFFWAFP